MKKTLWIISVLFFSLKITAQEFTLQLFAQGFSSPVEMAHAGDSRLFVVEQQGKIKILNPDGSVNPVPFLDVSTLISTGGERGLLGLAFSPDYADDGYFYLNYTNTQGNTVIARYQVSENPDVAQTNGTIILTFDQPFSNHNGGTIKFGPDACLWISTGDGGSGGDPQNNGQNTNSYLGKLLRISLNSESYEIPPDNPFTGLSGYVEEIWAYGLRNPWKFSFDRETGDLWIADVGQNQIEEINHRPYTEAGLNYGWRCYEGNAPYNTTGCENSETMIFPVAVYNHSQSRCSVTGGYVYRGSLYPNLIGKYFFGDYCSREIGWIDESHNMEFVMNSGVNISSFGEDVNGELYVLGNNAVHKIIGQEMGLIESEIEEVSVFPNPVSDILTIQTNENIQNGQLFTMSGNLIGSLKFQNNSTDLRRLPAGNYLIILTIEGIRRTYKILKK